MKKIEGHLIYDTPTNAVLTLEFNLSNLFQKGNTKTKGNQDDSNLTLNSFSTAATSFISCRSSKVVVIGSGLDNAIYAGLAKAL